MKKLFIILFVAMTMILAGCDDTVPTSDQVQHAQQEKLNQQANAEVGMPAIKNFTEKKMMALILEKRDDAHLATWTYTSAMNGKFRFVGQTIGYGLPYSTQFTNPQTVVGDEYHSIATIPQADPNGLFSPGSAEGTWIMMLNPQDKNDIEVVYMETRISVFPFPLPASEVEQ